MHGMHRNAAPQMLRFRAPNQCRGGGGQRAGRGLPGRALIREHHQRSAACQDVDGLPQGRLRSRPFTLIKDDAHAASLRIGRAGHGRDFSAANNGRGARSPSTGPTRARSPPGDSTANKAGPSAVMSPACSMRIFRRVSANHQRIKPAVKPGAWRNSWTFLHG